MLSSLKIVLLSESRIVFYLFVGCFWNRSMASQKPGKIPIFWFCRSKSGFSEWVLYFAEKLHMCDGQGQKVQRKWWEAEPPKNVVYMSPQWPPFLHHISTQNAEEFSGNSCHVFPCTMKLRATKCWPVVSNAGLTCDKQLYFSFSWNSVRRAALLSISCNELIIT